MMFPGGEKWNIRLKWFNQNKIFDKRLVEVYTFEIFTVLFYKCSSTSLKVQYQSI